jgi:hypothetical protein
MKKASKDAREKIVKAIREGRVAIGNKAVVEKTTPHLDVFKYEAGVNDEGNKYPAAKGFILSWSEPSRGFGEITFVVKGNKVEIDSEYMGRDFVMGQLAKLVSNSKIRGME